MLRLSRLVRRLVRRLWTEEGGATMVEYAVMVMLIAIACFGAVATIGAHLRTLYSNATNMFP